jgi:RND family efflux transporter MFP subunit
MKYLFRATLFCLLMAAGADAMGQGGDGKPPVTVCQPLQRDSADYDFPARLELDRVEIRAPVGGMVKKVHVKQGGKIKKGELLLDLDEKSFQESLQRAEDRVKVHEGELRKVQDLLDQGTKLLKDVSNKVLLKMYQDKLGEMQGPLDQAYQLTTAFLKKRPMPPESKLRILQAGLEKTLRIAKVRNKGGLDAFFEEELAKLRSLIKSPLFPGAKEADEQKIDAALLKLQGELDQVYMLSRARNQQGLQALAAERDLAAQIVKNDQRFIDQAKSDLNLSKIESPLAGQITELRVKPGDRLDAGTLVAAIARTDMLQVSFAVDEASLLRLQQMLRKGKGKAPALADIPVKLNLPKEKGFPHRGKLDFIENRVDPKNKTIRLHAVFPDPEGVLGRHVGAAKKAADGRVRLTLGESRKVLLIPPAAVVSESDGKRFVFVATEKNLVEKRPVQLGASLRGLQGIEDGLKAGDWVIVGSDRMKRDLEERKIAPEDFVQDLPLLRLRPGMVVEPLRVLLPRD